MSKLFENQAFGIALTIGLYALGIFLQDKIKDHKTLNFLNPLLIATVLGILFFAITGIPLDAYNNGGRILNFFLGPIVVTLALPLYRNRLLIRRHALPIMGTIIAASFVSICSVVLLSRLLGIDEVIIRSLMGKSTTTPIALELARMTGGNTSLAVLGVILTGNLGAMMANTLFHLLRIKHPIARGLALGSTSHAVGTAAAFTIGKTEGAMSGLAMGISGIVSVIWLPILLRFFGM